METPPANPFAVIYPIRSTRPGFFGASTAEENEMISRQFEHLHRHTEAGAVLLACPCLDNTFEIMVFKAASAEEAEAFMNSDPSLQVGAMAVELHPLRLSLMQGMR
ncbi:MAG: hypothetical protein WA110_06980 [Anaerolineaceae bacterium]